MLFSIFEIFSTKESVGRMVGLPRKNIIHNMNILFMTRLYLDAVKNYTAFK